MSEDVLKNTKYKLIQKISDTAYSDIFLVEFEGKRYALKSLKKSDPDSILRFRRESSTLARLNHPHLVKLVDASEQGNVLYLVMEHVEGDSLASRIAKSKSLSEDESIQIINSIADAVSELHKNNLVHRDIKPANILLPKDGAKLIDLGLVGDVEQIKTETALVGTPLYCSPEQTKILKRDVTFSSDLYSLGIVFFEALTGNPPFTGSLNDILQQHTSTPVPNLRILKPGIKESLVIIIEKLLAKDPDDRYQSALSLLHDLHRLDEIENLLSQKQDPKLGGKEGQSFAVRIKYIERKEEIEKLYNSWRDAKSGHPGLYLVNGASGSGKSRLCREFITRALVEEKNEILVLNGKSQYSNQDIPFGPLREAIDSLIASTFDGPKETQNVVFQHLKAAAEGRENYLLKFSKNLHKVLKKDNQENVETDVEGERDKFFSHVADFFIKLSQQWKALILFIDDLQWLDESSLQLIERLLNQSGSNSIFILGTARNDEKSTAAIKNLTEELGSSIKGQLEIGAFTKSQMSNLLSSYLGTDELEPAIVDFFYAKSTGNPFIAAEYLRAVVEQGFLVFRSNKWQIAGQGLEKLTFSNDVFDLIVKRIEGGSQELKSFARYASIYGNTFTAPDIAKVAQINSAQIKLVLAEGERLGLMDRVNESKWKFSHDKIPESIRQVLTVEVSRKICDELSDFYRKKIDLSDEEVFIVARLAASGNFEKNLEFTVNSNIKAGFLSLSNHAHAQAFTFLKCAFDLTDKMTLERADLLEISKKLAVSAAIITNWEVAERCVNKALELSQSKEELVSSLALKVWVKKTRADITTAWECFRKACVISGHPYPSYFHWKLLTTLWLFFASMFLRLTNIKLSFLFPADSKRGKSLRQLADLYFEAQYCSEYRQLLDFILVSLKILLIGQITGRKRELALGNASTGYAMASLGIKNMAVLFLNEAMRLSEELNDPVIKATCLSRKIEGFIFCGASYDGISEFTENSEIIHRYLNPTDIGRLRNSRALLLSFKGRNLEALNFLKTYVNVQNPHASKMAVLSTLNSLHLYWFNSSILGLVHEAQEAKSIALKTCSPYRFVPVAHRHVAVYELQLRRYLEEVDELVNDLREHYMGNFRSFTEMGGKLNFSQMVFLDLLELEKARSEEEKFSLRKKFKTNLQRLFFMIYSPLYRINYYFLKAMYYRITEKFSVAQKWLKICEDIADQTGHIRLMFEIQREYARICLKKNEILLMKTHLVSALQMASENQWRLTEEALISEFGDYAEQLLVNWSALAKGSVQGTIQGTIQSQGTIQGTVQGSASQGQVQSSSQNTVMAGANDAEQARFVDALLKVSHAFVSSLDMLEQSKSVLTQIVKLFAAERGFVFIKNEENNDYQGLTGKNAQGEDIAMMTGFSSTVVKKVLETAEPLIIASSDETEALGSESAVLYNLRSIIATPLMIKDRVLGVVYLDSSLMKGLFTKRDTHLFSTLANHISVSLELSRMAKVELEKAALRKELEIQAAVAEESKKVKVLVDNMQQALFSIAPDGTIVEPVSKFSQKVLGGEVAGKKLTQALYKDVSNKEVLAGIDTALTTVFGEDELQWDLMSDNFPRKVNYSGETQKTLKVQPSPVWDSKENLEKIVFVVEDITTLEELERKLNEQGIQSTILGEILESDFNDLMDFMTNTEKSIAAIKAASTNFTLTHFSTMLRDLHTLKGNARLFKMSLLSSQVHEIESRLLVFKDNLKDQEGLKNVFDPGMTEIENSLKAYQTIFQRIAVVRSASSGGVGVSELALKLLNGVATDLEKDLPTKKVQKLNWAIERLSFKSVKEIAQKYAPMVNDISKQLLKKVEFSVTGDTLISKDRSQLLNECLVHLLRNSIDHGLEKGEERIKAGKAEAGQLSIECAEEADSTLITISDDGMGIDGDQVLIKAIQKGIVTDNESKKMSPEEKINLIFSPNFSTKTEVSEISGRGIGLDVVKKNIETMDGELKVLTEKGKGSKFLIRLPNDGPGKVRAAG